MKKTFIHILAILASVTALASCEKFLDTVSYTERNTSNFPASEEDATQMVTGIYSAMIGPITNSPGTNFYIMLANMCSDDAFGGGGSGDIAAQAMDHFMTDHLERQKNLWTYDYQGIGRANMALANLDKVEDENLRNQLIGEALTMRSYYYFELAQVFEEVPLLTTVPQNVSEAVDYPAAASVDEIYGFMAAPQEGRRDHAFHPVRLHHDRQEPRQQVGGGRPPRPHLPVLHRLLQRQARKAHRRPPGHGPRNR